MRRAFTALTALLLGTAVSAASPTFRPAITKAG